MIVIKTLITILYQRTLNIQEVQLSLGSHEESLAHLEEARSLPYTAPSMNLTWSISVLKNSRISTSIPLRSRIFPFSKPK